MPAQIGPPDENLLEAEPCRDLLRRVTGLDPVPHGRHVVTDRRLVSVERISLVDVGGSVVASFWPAELKPQAAYLYEHGRAAAMIAAGRQAGWTVEGRPQLAFRNSRPQVRLYLAPVTDPDEVDRYARRWSGADRGRIGAHKRDALRTGLWPWLKQAGYAADRDDDVLDQYLVLLGNRDAFFRAALSFEQRWNRSSGDLVASMRAALGAPLRAAGELPLPGNRLTLTQV